MKRHVNIRNLSIMAIRRVSSICLMASITQVSQFGSINVNTENIFIFLVQVNSISEPSGIN